MLSIVMENEQKREQPKKGSCSICFYLKVRIPQCQFWVFTDMYIMHVPLKRILVQRFCESL